MENRLIPYEAVRNIGKGRILVLAPHPDDEVFGCGGAVLRQIAEGGKVKIVIATNGAHGANDPQSSEYADIRRAESIKAGEILGVRFPEFWDLEDRKLEYGEKLIQRIVHSIAEFSADYVYAPSLHEMHPDHRILGMAALEAVRRTPPIQLVMYEVGVAMLRPNVLLDISDLMQKKQAAMACFVSQLRVQAYDLQIRALNQFRSYTLGPEVQFAEAYRVVKAEELAFGPFELYESEYQRQRNLGLPVSTRDRPLVSVIVRCGSEVGLQQSLDSIALQTYTNAEVVVALAGQAEVAPLGPSCGRYPVMQLHPAGHTSLAHVSNLAMEAAHGQFLIILDAGDTFLPNHIERLAEALIGGSAMVAYTGVSVRERHSSDITILDEPWSVARLRGENFLRNAAILFHRSLVEKGCRLREQFGPLADWDFWLQMTAHSPFLHIPTASAFIYKASAPDDSGIHTNTGECDAFYEFWMANVPPREWSQTLTWYESNLRHSQSNVAQLNQDNMHLKKLIADANHQLSDIRQQLEASQAYSQSVENHCNELQSFAANCMKSAEMEISSILRSTSWRVTAPLRQLASLLKRR